MCRRLHVAGPIWLLFLTVAAGLFAAEPAKKAPPSAITYEDVAKLLELKIDEKAILERLRKSPTVFVLDTGQVKELKGLGASESLIAALQGRRPADNSAAEISDLVYILDCSNSMQEKTKEGRSKMEVAHHVVADLVRKTPEGLHVAFVIYGHDVNQGCKAVKVARPLSELDSAGKDQLAKLIGGLQPSGHTPIALALEAAGRELAKSDSYGGIVLITDGMETCHGKPDEVAAELAKNPRLSFGVNVIGFGVKAEEQAGVEAIAKAGKGDYYQADSAEQFAEVVHNLHKELESKVAAAPEQREKLKYQAAGKDAKPGAFLNDAPVVEQGEYKGGLEMMGAHYYQIPVRKGQELRAIAIVQKTPYQASNNVINQAFGVTIYDQRFGVQAHEKTEVAGNPDAPATVRAVWKAETDGLAYIGVAASDNHDKQGNPIDLYKDLSPKPSPYTLRIKLAGEAEGEAPEAFARVDVKPGSGFEAAGELPSAAVAGADLKLGEVLFYRCAVKKGGELTASVVVQKPWYEAGNKRIQATYTLTIYDDDQVQVAQKKLDVKGNPPEAQSLSVDWPVELEGGAYVSVACENSGSDVYPEDFEPKPGRIAVQIVER